MRKSLSLVGIVLALIVGLIAVMVTVAASPPSSPSTSTLNTKLDTITNLLNNGTYGLPAIATAQGGLNTKVDNVNGKLDTITETAEDIQANVVRMESVKGEFAVSEGSRSVPAPSHQGGQHVSLTLCYWGLGVGDLIYVQANGLDLVAPWVWEVIGGIDPGNGLAHVEFEASGNWYVGISADDNGGLPTSVDFLATVTYSNASITDISPQP